MSATYGHTISIDFFTAFFTPRTPREYQNDSRGRMEDRQAAEVTACELELSSYTGRRREPAHLLFIVAAAVLVVAVVVLFDDFSGAVGE